MNRRYYLLYRPPHIGTHPAQGEVARDVWFPSRRIPAEHQPEGGERHALGWVEYDRQLSEDEVYRYDLYPAAMQERERSELWRGR